MLAARKTAAGVLFSTTPAAASAAWTSGASSTRLLALAAAATGPSPPSPSPRPVSVTERRRRGEAASAASLSPSSSCSVRHGTPQRRGMATTSSNRSPSSAAAAGGRALSLDNMNPCVKKMEYAVRGPLVIRAVELEKELAKGAKKPFTDVIKANIGDAHAMGNRPITFLRQVLALVTYPRLQDSPDMPADAKKHARVILEGCGGGSVGSYSASPGVEVIRRHVASYIERRDGGVKSEWNNVILCAGASEGIRAVLKLFTNPNRSSDGVNPGVMIPIPQYPLYSATLAEFNIDQVGYYLNEERNWSLDVPELERSIGKARAAGTDVRAIVVINPGNPTGQVLSEDNIKDIIRFAQKEKLFIFADEVYQDNIYADGCAFHSFKKVMSNMGSPYSELELASFMSCSKGYMGECGIRGGYAELVNMDPDVQAMLNKSISAKLCPTVIGQACMDVVVNPPSENEASHSTFQAEKAEALASLAERARLVADTLNSMEGFSCNTVQGAMYAFPQLHFPPGVLKKAEEAGQPADVYYAFQLLENTGICIIPGSGFGQKPGTYHFRTTILPQKDKIVSMLGRIKDFHQKFLKDHS